MLEQGKRCGRLMDRDAPFEHSPSSLCSINTVQCALIEGHSTRLLFYAADVVTEGLMGQSRISGAKYWIAASNVTPFSVYAAPNNAAHMGS